jgi:hypothetical protein
LEDGTPPVLGVDLPGLLRETDEYLLDVLRVAFVGTLRRVQTLFVDGIQFPGDDLAFIELRTEIFGDFTRAQASRARLDRLIEQAFSGRPADVYVERLRDGLPRGNRFSRTVEVDIVDGFPDFGAVEGSETAGIPIESP